VGWGGVGWWNGQMGGELGKEEHSVWKDDTILWTYVEITKCL